MTIITEQDHFNDLENILAHEELRLIPKTGVVHIGADAGQEVAQYFKHGFEKIILIEANPDSYNLLVSKFGTYPNIRIFNYAVCDAEGVVDFHIHTSRSGSTEPASILPMKQFKEIVKTLHTARTIRVPAITLDALFEKYELAREGYNFLNIDIQGAELLALKGSIRQLSLVDAVVSEVNVVEMYENGAMEADIVDFLAQHGFDRKHSFYHTLYDEVATFPAWGESLFLKRTSMRRPGEA
jgi:FkbM family methyltransferase